MIGYLKGNLLSRHDPYILITVNNVGYKVCAASDVLRTIHIGDTVALFIHTHVREDMLELYGFLDEESLVLFELLLSVSGIGPKTAIGVFGLGKREHILHAIQTANVAFFTGVPRLGKKNAQKIIIELKGKLGAIEDLDLAEADTDAVGALVQFGFSHEEARRALAMVTDSNAPVEEKIKRALKYLGK